MNQTKVKKGFKMPHVFVILVTLVILAAAATYFVPAADLRPSGLSRQHLPSGIRRDGFGMGK